jgi:hypothetical protein
MPPPNALRRNSRRESRTAQGSQECPIRRTNVGRSPGFMALPENRRSLILSGIASAPIPVANRPAAFRLDPVLARDAGHGGADPRPESCDRTLRQPGLAQESRKPISCTNNLVRRTEGDRRARRRWCYVSSAARCGGRRMSPLRRPRHAQVPAERGIVILRRESLSFGDANLHQRFRRLAPQKR